MDPFFLNTPSGLGPQTGGFNPTPGDALWAQARMASSRGLMDYALYTDPRTRALAGFSAMGLAGDANTAYNMLHKDSKMGQVIKDVVGLAMTAGLVPGGSPMQLAASVQQMVASQGFSVGGNIGLGGSIYGSGIITDQISRSVFNNIRSTFYDGVTGLGKLGAHGLNMTDAATAFSQLSTRGAFAGMRIGDLKGFTNAADIGREIQSVAKEIQQANSPETRKALTEYQKELEALAKKGGGQIFKLDAAQMKKVNDTFSSFAGVLKEARSMFGSLPIQQLADNAERLVGASINELGSMETAKNRMAKINAVAYAIGANPAAIAGNITNMADDINQQMFRNAMNDPRMGMSYNRVGAMQSFGRLAAANANDAVTRGLLQADTQSKAAKVLTSRGRLMAAFDEKDIATMRAEGVMSMAGESSTFGNLDVAMYALSNGFITDPSTRQSLESMLQSLGSASIADQKNINAGIGAALERAGLNVGYIRSAMTPAELQRLTSIEYTNKKQNILSSALDSRLLKEELKEISYKGFAASGGLLGGKDNDRNMGIFERLYAAVDAATLDNLLGVTSEAELDALYANTPYLADALPKAEFQKMMRDLQATAGTGDVAGKIRTVMDAVRISSRAAPVGNTMARMASDVASVQNYLTSNSIGGKLDNETFAENLVRGFFGVGKITDDIVVQSLINKDSKDILTAKRNAAYGLNFDDKQIEQLSGILGTANLNKLYSDLNLNPGDRDGLRKALASASGVNALRSNLGDAVVKVTDDGIAITKASIAATEAAVLESVAQKEHARRLLGTDTNGYRDIRKKLDSTDLSTPEGREIYNKTLRDALTSSNRLDALADAAISENFSMDSEAMQALLAQYKADPQTAKMLTDLEKQYRAEADSFFNFDDEKDLNKANKVRELGQRLKMSAAGQQGEYLGVLQIMSDSLAQLQLYRNN